MKPLTQLVGAVAFLATLGCLFQGFSIPGKYNLAAASAIQMTQVYGEQQTWLLAAVALGIVALCCIVAARDLYDPFKESNPPANHKPTLIGDTEFKITERQR